MSQEKQIFLKAADFIGARLCRDAVWDGTRCNWLGDSMEFIGNTWAVVHRAFGPELYNGTSGIALFLARLFAETNERLYRVVAEGGVQQALSRIEDISPPARIGFYSGSTGVAYALIVLGEIFENQNFIEKALQITQDLAQDDIGEQGLDVISGSAGAIPALLTIYQKYRKDYLIDLAIQQGECLLNTARRQEHGWSWNTLNMPGEQDLTGFSHGTAGIAWALLELFQCTGQERFRDAAQQGFRYERNLFNAEHENWPDFRSFYESTGPGAGTPAYAVAWCHGAPGIGLSRLRAYEISGEESYRSEAEAALRTTMKMLNQSAFMGQGNYSLCHGLAGNTELVIYASQILRNADYKVFADQIGRQGIEQYQKNYTPWPCGVNGGGETPNLMLGLAGIGYFYLRLYDPVKNPSILILSSKSQN